MSPATGRGLEALAGTERALYRVDTVRRIEQAALASEAPGALMRRAGLGAAGTVRRAAGSRRRVLVLAGPGNNGGDGAICAAALAAVGFEVTVALAHAPPPGASDAGLAWAALPASVERVADVDGAACSASGSPPEVIVDALFGIGLSRAVSEPYAAWIRWANTRDALRIALDVPSGLSADTGAVVSQGTSAGACFRAHETLTFIADKPGLHTAQGPDHAGRVRVAPLDSGRPAAAAAAATASTTPPDGFLVGGATLAPHAARLARARDSHKGRFGTVALVGGAPGMAGALLLASRAALCTGAGRVRAGFLGGAPLAVDPQHPEAMLTDAGQALGQAPSVVAIGPGLGRGDEARRALSSAIGLAVPLVLDADALNLLAQDEALRKSMTGRGACTVLTPHPLEAARMLGSDTAAVQRDRVGAACRLAASLQAVVVLKGAGSVIATADGRFWINASGGPALAAGGTGDVLTGFVAALLAQLDDALGAALLGTWLHGAAGDAAAARAGGDTGVLAGELAPQARRLLNRLIRACPRRP